MMFRKPTFVAALALGLAGLYSTAAQATAPNRRSAAIRRAAAQGANTPVNTLVAMGELNPIAAPAPAPGAALAGTVIVPSAALASALAAAVQAAQAGGQAPAVLTAMQAAVQQAADEAEALDGMAGVALADEDGPTVLFEAWVANHPDNPYPSPAALTALAYATNMTEAEVASWFQANIQ